MKNEEKYYFGALSKEEIMRINDTRNEEEKLTNVGREDLKVIQDFCKANDAHFIGRPVNPDAFLWNSKGAANKSMFVHGKSADRGIGSGLIPVVAGISKAGNGDDLDKIKKFQKENEHSIEYAQEKLEALQHRLYGAKKFLTEKGLQISEESLLKNAQIAGEEFDPIILPVTLRDKKGNDIYVFTAENGSALRPEGDKEGHVYAIRQNGKFRRIDESHEPTGELFDPPNGYKAEEFRVMGQPEFVIGKDAKIEIKEIKPITADIDTLAYGTKLDLGEQKQEDHKSILREDKKFIIGNATKNFGVSLFEEEKKDLIEKPIDSILKDKRTSIDSLLNADPKILGTKEARKLQNLGKLYEALKDAEVKREHLKGMGEGVRTGIDITGAMRADFKRTQISHGSEQFNEGFTQPLDKSWFYVDSKGAVSEIKGEEQLIKAFNEINKNGYSCPPNPNWGWKLNKEGSLEIDQGLKEQNKLVDSLIMKRGNTGNKEQDRSIGKIADQRLELGKLASRGDKKLTGEAVEAKISELKKSLDKNLANYKEKFEPKSLAKEEPKVEVAGKEHIEAKTSSIKANLAKRSENSQAGKHSRVVNQAILKQNAKKDKITFKR